VTAPDGTEVSPAECSEPRRGRSVAERPQAPRIRAAVLGIVGPAATRPRIA
jgi:hypothetical protein